LVSCALKLPDSLLRQVRPAYLASAAVYQDRVVIDWPSYSTAFGWGSEQYRYLNTDKDFQ